MLQIITCADPAAIIINNANFIIRIWNILRKRCTVILRSLYIDRDGQDIVTGYNEIVNLVVICHAHRRFIDSTEFWQPFTQIAVFKCDLVTWSITSLSRRSTGLIILHLASFANVESHIYFLNLYALNAMRIYQADPFWLLSMSLVGTKDFFYI